MVVNVSITREAARYNQSIQPSLHIIHVQICTKLQVPKCLILKFLNLPTVKLLINSKKDHFLLFSQKVSSDQYSYLLLSFEKW
jgi:hypothetical protein